MKLSAVLIVKNEEQKLMRCLDSIKHLVDEIIIVDTGSTDSTISIAEKYTPHVFHYPWDNSFCNARNFSLSKSSGDYNLIIDADEIITIIDQEKITTFINNNNQLGIITLKNKVEQKGEIFFQFHYLIRLIPKGVNYIGNIHEQVNSNLPETIVPIEITHDGYYKRSHDKFHRNINLLKIALQKTPKEAYLLYQLSNEYYGLNDLINAKTYFEKCYKIITYTNPIFPQHITGYITFCKASKDFDSGLRVIQEQEQYLENYPDFYFVSGGFYLEYVLHDIEHNIEFIQLVETCYLACLEIGDITHHSSLLGTGSFLAQYNLGVYYETTQQIEKAKSYYTLAKEHGYAPAIQRLNDM